MKGVSGSSATTFETSRFPVAMWYNSDPGIAQCSTQIGPLTWDVCSPFVNGSVLAWGDHLSSWLYIYKDEYCTQMVTQQGLVEGCNVLEIDKTLAIWYH